MAVMDNRGRVKITYGSGGTATGGWPWDGKVITIDTEDTDADYSSLEDAYDSADSGDTIAIGSETLNPPETGSIPDGVGIVGHNRVNSIISKTGAANAVGLNINDDCVIESLKIIANSTGGVAAYGIRAASTMDNAKVTDVDIVATQETIGDLTIYGIGVAAGTDVELHDVNINASQPNTTGGTGITYGVYISSGSCEIHGGKIEASANTGAAYAVYNNSGTVKLYGPTLIGGIGGGGDYEGWYYDENGSVVQIQSAWYDYSLYDTANSLGMTSHWRDNDSSYPAGWTESDAANDANTNDVFSFWSLKGSDAEVSWDYRRQNSMTLETVADWVSVQIGPCLLRDGEFAADIDYYVGMYRDNSGIDTTVYSRVHIWWDSGNALWKIRGEEHDGTVGHNGSWVTIDQDPLQPFYIRFAVTGAAAKTTRQYFGASYITDAQTLLQSQAPTTAPTWGQFWVRLHQSRGAGVTDAFIIGSIDYIASA
jgi:hypothetical protein